MSLCIDVNETTSLLVTAGFILVSSGVMGVVGTLIAGSFRLQREEWGWWEEGHACPAGSCSWTPIITEIFLCFLLPPPSLTSMASSEHCAQCPDLWVVRGAEGGGMMYDWNPRTKVSVWCSGGAYNTTHCVLHCCWLSGCDTQLLWTLVQPVQLANMAVLRVESRSWETEEIQLLSFEVEKHTEKLYQNVNHSMSTVHSNVTQTDEKNNKEKNATL